MTIKKVVSLILKEATKKKNMVATMNRTVL